LVGAGTAAYYASLAIRARHADAKVLMIGEETHLPYNRPPLSKELWWYGDEESANTLQYEGLSGKKRDGFFVPPSELSATSHGGVSLLRGRRVSKLCPDEKKAYLEDGHCISYSKCLIATGGKPKVLPELENVPENVKGKILYLRGVEICKSSKSISIVGGGFLGSELAYSIQRKYKNVKITQVVAEKGNLSGIFPEFLSMKASEALRDVGVDVITNAKVCVIVQVNGSQCIASDCVVVAVGIQPDTLVAEASGLEIDSRSGGISADAELRVRSDIWAAGDAASFYDKTLGRRRIEHWDNAQISGRLAGENMTGAGKAFWYQPAFFSKIAPQWQISAVGITDSSLPTVSVFAKEVRFYSFTAILRFFVHSIICAKCFRIIPMSAVNAE
uniref:Pyr_redox_2 domain-containing protein n=1 Tax=Angiostrongylus cantonensis TaxID=6313 RepID=A0A0K0D1B0_ANGCA